MPTYNSYLGDIRTSGAPYAVKNDFDGSQNLAAIGFTATGGANISFTGGNLLFTTSDANGWQTQQVIRQSSEDSTNGTAYLWRANGSSDYAVIARYQRGQANTYYMATYNVGASLLIIYSVVSATINVLGTKSVALTSGHVPRIDFWVRPNATTGTDLSVYLSDVTTQTTIDHLDVLGDTTSALQGSGGYGFTAWTGNFTMPRFGVFAGGASPVVSGVKGVNVVCAGNSITWGYKEDGTQIATPYPVALASLLGAGYNVVNQGYSGQNTDYIFGFNPVPNRGIASPFIDSAGTGQTVFLYNTINKLDYSQNIGIYMEGTNSLNYDVVNSGSQSNNDIFLRIKQAAINMKAAGFDKVYVGTFIASTLPTNSGTPYIPSAAYIARRDAINNLIRADSSLDGIVDMANIADSGATIFQQQSQISNATWYQVPGTTHPTVAGAGKLANAGYGYLKNTAIIPKFTTQPTDVTVAAGTPFTLTSAVSGIASPTSQWSKGAIYSGTPISGATSATFTNSNPQTSDSGTYYNLATNANGQTFSNIANVTVSASGSIPTDIPTIALAYASNGITVTPLAASVGGETVHLAKDSVEVALSGGSYTYNGTLGTANLPVFTAWYSNAYGIGPVKSQSLYAGGSGGSVRGGLSLSL